MRAILLASLTLLPSRASFVVSHGRPYSGDFAPSPDPRLPSLLAAAAAGDVGGVESAIRNGADLDTRDNDGWTALVWAANRGRPAILNLIAAGARLDVPDAAGSTPLLHAIAHGHSDVANALVSAGASVKLANKHGLTPLALVLEKGDDETVRSLCVRECSAARPPRPVTTLHNGPTPALRAA